MKPQRGKAPNGRKNNNSPSCMEPVSVYCRIRPLDDPNESACIKPLSNSVVQLQAPENAPSRNGQIREYQYTYQQVYDGYTSQKNVFDMTAKPLVEDLLVGKNGLLFTYGITGSGKTYTMTGFPHDQGILPRCLDVLFNSIGKQQAKKYVFRPDHMNGFEVQSEADAMMDRQKKDILPGLTSTGKTPMKKAEGGDAERLVDPTCVEGVEEDNHYAVFVSYIEIYNNHVYDLLEELPYNTITGYKPPQTKILRSDSSDNMYVHNCTEIEVKQPQDAIDVFYKGQRRRKVAHTTLNVESSRSHSVFNIRLVQAPLDNRGEEVIQDREICYDSNRICVSQLSLVDLAGSERTNRTKTSGDRLKEAGNINQSLMVLRTCLEMLRENQKQGASRLVPYRDSRLTHLFKTFFDGDGKVRMIVCVNPKSAEYDETIHVMKFAEMTQEVLITKAHQANKFDPLPEKPRKRANTNSSSSDTQMEQQQPKELPPIFYGIPASDYILGPPFPALEVVDPSDTVTISNIVMCLNERIKRRSELSADLSNANASFRASLVEYEREFAGLKVRCHDLEEVRQQKEKDLSRLDGKYRLMERKVEEMNRQLKDLEKENQLLNLQVQDKTWKIHVEKTSKERLKNDFKARLQMNNEAWEKNMEKAKKNLEQDAADQLGERDRKLELLRDLVNEGDTPVYRRRAPIPTPKPRTYTTPATVHAGRSESELSSLSSYPSSARATSRATARTNYHQTRNAVSSKISSAKSIPNISQIGATPTSSKTRQPTVNTRYNHRRSKSAGSSEVWLDHKPSNSVPTNTIMQPKMDKKKSVTRLNVKDTKGISKYVLTHQEQDSSDEMVTKLVKGDVIPTASGGSAVIFKDVETLKQVSPGTRKRRSPSQPMYDPDLPHTDVEERCSVALEGHRKRSKTTNL